MTRLQAVSLLSLLLLGLVAFQFSTSAARLHSRLEFDRRNLQLLFEAGSFDNDLVLDSYLIAADGSDPQLVNTGLLGLRRDRFAYRARRGDEVLAVAVPATAEDGFNGTVDLLVSIDMYGRIIAARVLENLEQDEQYGVVEVIPSRWMESFSGAGMRDIQRISWQSITDEKGEYDRFVGASLTPRAVADRVYDTVVFFQSNRIALIAGR